MATPIIPISVTPFAGGVPKAGSDNKIAAGWIPDLSGTYAPLVHTHAAADIVSGVLANARVNFAAPDAIGGTTPAAVRGTTVYAPVIAGGGGASDTLVIKSNNSSNNVDLGYWAAFHKFFDRTGSTLYAAVSSGAVAVNTAGVLSVDEVGNLTQLTTPSNLGLLVTTDQATTTVNGIVFNRTNRAAQDATKYITTWNWNSLEVAHLSNLGDMVLRPTDAITNAVTTALTLNHKNASPGALPSFGVGFLMTGDSSSTPNQEMAAWEATWTTSAHLSRASLLAGYVWNVGTKIAAIQLAPTTVSFFSTAGATPLVRFVDTGSNQWILGNAQVAGGVTTTTGAIRQSNTGQTVLNAASGAVVAFQINGSTQLQLAAGSLTVTDAVNFILATGTGSKIGTGATQKLGFWNATPVVQNTGWTAFANLTTDKTLDANSTTLDEVADVLGTLIETLKTYGLLAA